MRIYIAILLLTLHSQRIRMHSIRLNELVVDVGNRLDGELSHVTLYLRRTPSLPALGHLIKHALNGC